MSHRAMETDLNSIFGKFLKCGSNQKTTCTTTQGCIFMVQGSVFELRECAQSIPRIKLSLEGHLLKTFKKFSTPTLFWTFVTKALFLEGCCMERWSARKTRTYIWPKAAAYLSRWCTPLENKKRISVQTSLFDY